MGVIVPKHKHSAVERNRLKRRLREAVRQHIFSVLPAVDLVIRAQPSAYDASYEQLVEELGAMVVRVTR